MKKNDSWQRELLITRQHKIKRQESCAAGIRRFRTAKKSSSKSGLQVKTLLCPEFFSLRDKKSRDLLTKLIHDMNVLARSGYCVRLNFKATARLFPCGTLYFVASVDELLLRYPGRIRSTHPANDVVEQLFQHIGLLKKLGLTHRKDISEITDASVVRWHHVSGHNADTTSFAELLLQYEKGLGGEVPRSEFYGCMSEAVTNTRKHAYPAGIYSGPLLQGNDKQWWMFSSYENGKLEVSMCDLGVGISATMYAKPLIRDHVRKLWYHLAPSKLERLYIEEAVKSSASSSRLPYRGKGLPEMLEFIKKGTTGGFAIYSDGVCYQYDASTQEEASTIFDSKISGTLIQWSLLLKN